MGRSLRVLIADDRGTARRGLRALLCQFPQVEVVGEAANGQESVVLVSTTGPDVVILDIEMPVMDGIEATKRIKGEWPEVRVVALSMHATYRAPALAAGADAFLLKGCTAQEMRRAIRPSPEVGQRSTQGNGAGRVTVKRLASDPSTSEGGLHRDHHTIEG